MLVLATIEAPVVIRKILTHLGLPTRGLAPRPVGRPVRLELSPSIRGVVAALYPIASHPNPADVAADGKKLRATERPMGCDGVVTGSAVLGKHTL